MANIKILDKSLKTDILRKIGEEEGLYYVTYLNGKAVSEKIDFEYAYLFMANFELSPREIAKRMVQGLIVEGHFKQDGQSIYIVFVSKHFNAFLGCDNATELRFVDSATLREIKKGFGM